MLASVSGQQMAEWQAFYQLEPFGIERDSWHAALIAATIVNVNRDPKKEPMDIDSFLLKFDDDGGKPASDLEEKLKGIGFFKTKDQEE